MQNLIGAILLLALLVGVLIITTRYAYLAWFQTDKFRRMVQHAWPAWQRNAPIFRSAWKWMDSPTYILAARVTTMAALLFCIFLLVLTVKAIALTIIHTFGG